MLNRFFEAVRPAVYAHRGGSALAPENTVAAFDRGLSCGADGLELDVQLSRDRVVVVHHDVRLERTTQLAGRIADYGADELASADAGYHFRPRVPSPPPAAGRVEADAYPFRGKGVGIPTLAEVLARYAVPLIIELKLNDPELARRTVDVVRQFDAVGRTCIGSSGGRALREIRRLEPRLATSAAREEVRWALYWSKARWPVRRAPYQGYQVPECSGSTRVVSRRFVEDAHRAGLGVQVWTVDEPEAAHRLLDWGVDGLITDRPDIMVPLVRERAAGQAPGGASPRGSAFR